MDDNKNQSYTPSWPGATSQNNGDQPGEGNYTPSYHSQPGVTYTPPVQPQSAQQSGDPEPEKWSPPADWGQPARQTPPPQSNWQPPVQPQRPAQVYTRERFDDDENFDERKRRERKTGASRVIAALLVICMLIAGGGMGIGIKYLVDQSSEQPGLTPIVTIEPNSQNTVNSNTPYPAAASAERMSPDDIYAQSVESCVGISVEVTVDYGWFGTQTGTISGSGFVISSDGYIVTNNHVIEEAYNQALDVTVSMHDGTEYTAVIVGAEPANDVALLKIEPKTELKPLPIGSLDNMRIGEDVYVIGNPLGYLTFTMTEGILSAFDRDIHTDTTVDESGINMFQISAAINKGNSGGPVFNDRGEVIGIASAKSGEASVEGLGFAIPMDDVRDMIANWREVGYRPRPILGCKVTAINGVNTQTGYKVQGAGIVEVTPGGAAERAGILMGDVVTKVDDHSVTNNNDLIQYVRKNYAAGDTATLTIYRYADGKEERGLKIEVTFDGADAVVAPSPSPTLPDFFNG